MEKKKISDFKIKLKIMDSVTNQEIAKEKKDLILLSYETELKGIEKIHSCYTSASSHRDRLERNPIPFFEKVVDIFIVSCLDIAMKKASNFISTPEGSYPNVEINKAQIEANHPELVLQRIDSHLRMHTEQYNDILKERILSYLIENNFSYETNGIINSPINEVW